jgi:hypothetical protein
VEKENAQPADSKLKPAIIIYTLKPRQKSISEISLNSEQMKGLHASAEYTNRQKSVSESLKAADYRTCIMLIKHVY